MMTGGSCHDDRRRTTQSEILQQKRKIVITKEVIKISTYIHFTKEEREQARRTDLATFLINQGEKIKKSGTEYE
jgi:hypothetical protein